MKENFNASAVSFLLKESSNLLLKGKISEEDHIKNITYIMTNVDKLVMAEKKYDKICDFFYGSLDTNEIIDKVNEILLSTN